LLGEPVTDKTPLKAGERVHVEWQGSCWTGEVLALNDDGTVRIRYVGWGSEWDETVARSRLQLPTTSNKVVTLHFDRTWSISGTLLEILPDGYVLSRAEDHRICLISKQSVAYVETERYSA
jgi:hypothetical protein